MRTSATTLLVVAGVLSTWASSPLSAQDGVVTLRGRVVDAELSSPLPWVFVSATGTGTGTLSDSLGYFLLRSDRAESYELRFSQLGYHPLEVTMPAEAESRAFTVGLRPDPIALEALTVIAESFVERRVGPYGPVTLLEQAELIQSPLGTAYELTRRVIPLAELCSREADSLCVSRRGQPELVTVCIDGRLVSSGNPVLETLDPRTLYLVEALPRVGQVKMFTRGYITRLIQNGQTIPPLAFECDPFRGKRGKQ